LEEELGDGHLNRGCTLGTIVRRSLRIQRTSVFKSIPEECVGLKASNVDHKTSTTFGNAAVGDGDIAGLF
jgi:hypothetical protein